MKCNYALFFLLAIFYKNQCYAVDLLKTSYLPRNNNLTVRTEEEIWGPILEEWALEEGSNYRASRVMQIPISDRTYIVSDPKYSELSKESKINNGKIVANNPNNNTPTRQVSETDLYLLSAIEKLVYKVNIMEKRLRRVEEMLYFLMAGNRVDTEPCMENFTRVGQQCYMFASMAGREYNWKVASKHCKMSNAVLAEMETIEENQNVIDYIQSHAHLKGKDFWIGGLNPGLLWIWSNNARPVVAPGSQHNKDNPSFGIQGEGRCLKLAYNVALRSYEYKGADCSVRYSYICESPESTSSNEIQRIGRMKNIFNEL